MAKFAAGVVDTGGAPFEKNRYDTYVIIGGLGEDDSWKKTWSKKSRDTVTLNGLCHDMHYDQGLSNSRERFQIL